MKGKTMLPVILIIFASCNDNPTCERESLIGVWEFINSFPGRITHPDHVDKEQIESNYGIPVLLIRQDCTFVDHQGCYNIEGRYAFDENKCQLTLINYCDDKRDSNSFEVTYLHENHLIMSSICNEPTSYLYKRLVNEDRKVK
jgi:hypothetical protein